MGISRRMIQRLTRKRAITLNRRPAYLGRKTRSGDRIGARIAAPEPATLQAVAIPLRVVHEDDDLLVVDKPAGLLVHPTSPHHHRTLSHGVAHHFQARGIQARVRPVHRLDRETSGLMIFATSAWSHQRIDRQLRDGSIIREYLALVEGEVKGEKGSIDAPIGREGGAVGKRVTDPTGRPALTRYTVVERLRDATLLRLRLETGRTHQIRVHLAAMGHPVIGDARYGGRRWRGSGRHALHAAELAFTHPRTGAPLRFSAPLPAEMARLLDELRNDSGESQHQLLEQDDREEGDDR